MLTSFFIYVALNSLILLLRIIKAPKNNGNFWDSFKNRNKDTLAINIKTGELVSHG